MDSRTERIFTSESAIWRIARENVLLLGGPAAAILQIAHPQVASGVAAHSNFRKDALGRLLRTLKAVRTITFGTRGEAEEMSRRIHSLHARVSGDSPRRYSAYSPDAQCWVLATLIALSVEIYERLVAPLTQETKENFLSDMKVFGEWFGLPETYGPAKWAEFRRYYEEMLSAPDMASLTISRELADHIADPRSLYLRMGGPFSSLAAREFLPSPIRERLGLDQTSYQRRVTGHTLAAIHMVLPVLPDRIRYASEYLSARPD